MGRYTGSPDTLVFDQRIDLRGFSAGSFAGLSTLHLLWKIPNVVTNGKLGAIACPPQLIVTPPTDHTLHLLHYEADQLCVWKPGEHQLDQLKIRYTYVSTEGPAYKEHFGAKEHNYSHWLSLNHTAGWWDLARFLFVNPEAASTAKRDAAPLRLLSWLSFRLEPSVDELIEGTMTYLSTVDKVKDSDLLALGTTHLKMQALFEKDERLIFKRFAKICLLSKQISMKTSLWDFSSLLEKSKVEIGTFKFVPLLSTLFALRCVVSLVVYSLVPLFILVQVREGGISSIF